MAEAIPGSDDQVFQHFLTNSPWDDQGVVDQVASDTTGLIGGKKDSCLLIDETGTPKKGDKSVGVSRQWCGQLGKVDNCQTGVFTVLNFKEHAVPIGHRLFLPEAWVDDEERCVEAGVPQEHIEFHQVHITRKDTLLKITGLWIYLLIQPVPISFLSIPLIIQEIRKEFYSRFRGIIRMDSISMRVMQI